MKRFQKFKPAFWDYQNLTGSHPNSGINFQRKWKLIVLFTSFMALLPLIVMTLVDFNLTRRVIRDEVKNSMITILKSAALTISFSSDREKSALDYIQQLDPDTYSDTFLMDSNGILVTASAHYGPPGTEVKFIRDQLTDGSGIVEDITPFKKKVLAGVSKIPGTSFFIVLVKSENQITDLWFKPRLKLIGYLIVSIVIILLSILGMATFLVGRIHKADERRGEALHHAEYTNKLASIGRLASGVAHEINNPLAIINQKTGLILDLFELNKNNDPEGRLEQLANDVLDSVNRCGTITRRLLDFARHLESSIETVDINEVLAQVTGFLEKEAERRGIAISVESKGETQLFECDKGSLQRIFLNLVDNALDAMEEGGKLDITIDFEKNKQVVITVADNGRGISDEDINKIFEPFYSTKNKHWGAGLGLSITFGLVKEINGDIRVKSRVGEGTCFTITLPINNKYNIKTQPE